MPEKQKFAKVQKPKLASPGSRVILKHPSRQKKKKNYLGRLFWRLSAFNKRFRCIIIL